MPVRCRRAAAWSLLALGLLAGAAAEAWAQELPPPPSEYFNDYAGLVSPEDGRRLDEKLRVLDREESTQVVVAIFRKLPWPSLEDYTIRTAESWRVGRQELDNGAILFLFVEDRTARIEVGYGLEGVLPDALARRILDNEAVPRFRQGDWAGGLEAAIDAVVAAVEGEYTAPEPAKRRQGPSLAAILIVVALVVLFLLLVRFGSPGGPPGRTYGRGGWRHDGSHWGGGRWGGGSSWGGGGGGGGFGGGGGGFMGGGGSFGGGGASSSW